MQQFNKNHLCVSFHRCEPDADDENNQKSIIDTSNGDIKAWWGGRRSFDLMLQGLAYCSFAIDIQLIGVQIGGDRNCD